jgi:uncharacterized protein
VSPVEAALLLLGAGVVAGVVGSSGGVSSLVSYPALLGVGIPPLPANIANLVAGVAIAPGTALSSRRELADARSVLIRLLPVSVAGTVLGAGLLLVTPPGVFARVVPFLVLAGSMVLIVQPALLKLRGRADVEDGSAAPTFLMIGAVSVYGGYFGAGSGVMLLAVLLLLVDSRVPPANAIKNLLLGAISSAAAAVFIAIRPLAVERCASLGCWATGRQLDRPHHRPPPTTEPRTVDCRKLWSNARRLSVAASRVSPRTGGESRQPLSGRLPFTAARPARSHVVTSESHDGSHTLRYVKLQVWTNRDHDFAC